VVTVLYLEAVSGSSRIEAARSRVASAQALYDQAASFKQNGLVAGIDVLRAEVQLRALRQNLISNENEFEKQKLRLARAIGLPGGAPLRLTEAMPQAAAPALPNVEQALALAWESRMDYRSLQARVKAAALATQGAQAGRLPTVAFAGDYGANGKGPANAHGSFTAGVAMSVPVFDGNRVKAEVTEAQARENQLKAALADLRGRIEFEIRNAQLDLRSSGERLEVARGALELARLQETQARDRFAAGVTSNLEVVQAQEAVAQADENLIGGLLANNLARASLARAIGASEKNVPEFLRGAK
jgi:outer membrane protein TolC